MVFEGRWGNGEFPRPSKSTHKLKRESFTRKQKEVRDTW